MKDSDFRGDAGMGGSHGNPGSCPYLLILLQATCPMLGLRWLRDASMLMMSSLVCPPAAACCCCAALRPSGSFISLCTWLLCYLHSGKCGGLSSEPTELTLGRLLLHEQYQRRRIKPDILLKCEHSVYLFLCFRAFGVLEPPLFCGACRNECSVILPCCRVSMQLSVAIVCCFKFAAFWHRTALHSVCKYLLELHWTNSKYNMLLRGTSASAIHVF